MVKDIIKIIAGIILILIGLIGGLVPIFQGWIFGIPGLILLSKYFPPIKKLLKKSKLNKKDNYTNAPKYKIFIYVRRKYNIFKPWFLWSMS